MAPKAKARGKAKAKARVRVRLRPAAAVVPVLRRPAARGQAVLTALQVWEKGDPATLVELDPRDIMAHPTVVAHKAVYYHHECKVAGKFLAVNTEDAGTYGKMELSGTTHDGLLQYQTGNPTVAFRVHLCHAGCNQEEVADNMLHIREARKQKLGDQEEGWVANLEKALPRGETDELRELRARSLAVPGEEREPAGKKEGEATPKTKESKKAKKEKKKKKKKKEKEAKKEESSDEDEVALDGSDARLAGQKEAKVLFSGTGLDPKEKVRLKVKKRARRYLLKKATKDSSTSTGGSSSSSSSGVAAEDHMSLFGEDSKVRKVGEHYPGVLTADAISTMKESLVQEIGMETASNRVMPVALSYCRQNLLKKASGPQSRELLTLSTTIDHLLKGKVAAATDTLMQRLKSVEQALSGSHWTVAQQQELLPQEAVTLTSREEAAGARKEVYQDSRAKWQGSFPDGRVPRGQVQGGKNTNKGGNKGTGKDRRDGKNQKGKGDGKKKDDAAEGGR